MKIVVLAGGISTERDVSLNSGKNVYDALCRLNHEAIFLDVFLGFEGEITEELFSKKSNLIDTEKSVGDTNPDIDQVIAMRNPKIRGFFGPGVLDLCKMADIVFLALHGKNGEDGKLQAAFDLMDIKYTGTDSVSSMLSMDKDLTKQIFIQHKIPTPEGFCLKKGIDANMPTQYPLVVKVTNGGSSVGVYICQDETEYKQAIKEGFKFDDKLLVEQFIKGREFTCGVIDGKALPIVEIQPVSGFYDYKNKYKAGATIETCPAKISEELTKEIKNCAEAVFAALRLSSYARMDFMIDSEGKVYCLEANTLPGMTKTSLLPQEAKAEGIDFDALCQKIIDVSLKKYEEL